MSNQTKDSKTEAREKTSMASNLLDYVGEKLDPRQEVPLDQRLAQLTLEQKAQLQEIEDNAIRTFKGMLDDLESALGILRIGHHVGWKVLYMAHSKKTVRKYEEILNIRIRDIFPEKGPSADRSLGLALAEKYSNFWKVVSGEIKITNRREIK